MVMIISWELVSLNFCTAVRRTPHPSWPSSALFGSTRVYSLLRLPVQRIKRIRRRSYAGTTKRKLTHLIDPTARYTPLVFTLHPHTNSNQTTLPHQKHPIIIRYGFPQQHPTTGQACPRPGNQPGPAPATAGSIQQQQPIFFLLILLPPNPTAKAQCERGPSQPCRRRRTRPPPPRGGGAGTCSSD